MAWSNPTQFQLSAKQEGSIDYSLKVWPEQRSNLIADAPPLNHLAGQTGRPVLSDWRLFDLLEVKMLNCSLLNPPSLSYFPLYCCIFQILRLHTAASASVSTDWQLRSVHTQLSSHKLLAGRPTVAHSERTRVAVATWGTDRKLGWHGT